MNKFILEQLNKTKIKLPEYNENTTQLYIKKAIGLFDVDKIILGRVYKVYLEDYIINEPPNFTLSANWNNNTKPPENKGQAMIVREMGKMYRIKFLGMTTNIQWEGWIPQKSMKIFEE